MARNRMREQILITIREVPRGHVSSYGAVARAAGYPGAARQVAWTLHASSGLPWHRILGSGGEIKLRGEAALEQRLRLESEGITFRGRRVNMALHEFRFPAKARSPSSKRKSGQRVRRRPRP